MCRGQQHSDSCHCHFSHCGFSTVDNDSSDFDRFDRNLITVTVRKKIRALSLVAGVPAGAQLGIQRCWFCYSQTQLNSPLCIIQRSRQVHHFPVKVTLTIPNGMIYSHLFTKEPKEQHNHCVFPFHYIWACELLLNTHQIPVVNTHKRFKSH